MPPAPASGLVQLSFNDLEVVLKGQDSSLVLKQLYKAPVEAYYHALVAATDDQAFVVNDIKFSQVHSQLIAAEASFKAISQGLASMGDMAAASALMLADDPTGSVEGALAAFARRPGLHSDAGIAPTNGMQNAAVLRNLAAILTLETVTGLQGAESKTSETLGSGSLGLVRYPTGPVPARVAKAVRQLFVDGEYFATAFQPFGYSNKLITAGHCVDTGDLNDVPAIREPDGSFVPVTGTAVPTNYTVGANGNDIGVFTVPKGSFDPNAGLPITFAMPSTNTRMNFAGTSGGSTKCGTNYIGQMPAGAPSALTGAMFLNGGDPAAISSLSQSQPGDCGSPGWTTCPEGNIQVFGITNGRYKRTQTVMAPFGPNADFLQQALGAPDGEGD